MASASGIDFRQSFREEAREILVDLEACLLELNERRDDGEVVGRVFRALHTIKGSGAMFGFDDLAAFTHNLENAFDEVRKDHIAVTAELVDLTLSALDQIRGMVEGSGDDPAACARILTAVGALMARPQSPTTTHADPAGNAGSAANAERVTAAPPAGTAEEGERRVWRIHFAPGPEMLRNGADPLLLLRELGQMGTLAVEAELAAIPPLAELEPDRCYVSWEMTLATGAGLDAIRDVFIFVEDLCELQIAPAAGENDGSADATARSLEDPRSTAGRRSYDRPDNAASLRVPAARLDQLVNLVGELVTVQARLSEIATRSEDGAVGVVAEEIERLTAALRENSMNLRMMPIRGTFERFRRLVHDLARDLGKNVELTIEGADTELDKTVIDQLGDPLMHLIRNSMDHGIESPAERAAQGKRPMATIHLAARHSGASVVVEVSDDGAGIDSEAVRARAIERGLAGDDTPLSDEEIFAFIFQAGFSTARQVTDVSGRGVGMDVVRQRVESLHGSIDVASRRGEGTRVALRLPLTLAIIDGLLVTVGDGHFVLPLLSTLECVELTRADVEQANGRHVACVRGEIIPYIRLRQYFRQNTPPPEREQIMIVESEIGRCGLVVDQVLGSCQTVIRNLGRFYRQVQMVSGATILGNGTLALILDPQRLVQEATRAQGTRRRPPRSSIPGKGGEVAAGTEAHGEVSR
ncbi:MAG TPA: chemotaxis protein CheA [Acidobacteriaceae bacterium]|nr:chemotaxis protein CheA [Acidobacteriaceae bacterium]